MYKVYGRVKSRASRVLWLLEELGQPYEFVDVGPHDPQVKALNGSGKIPVLVDGDHVITDSSAIMTYLADKHGQLTYPAGTPERAKQDALLHTILDEIDGVLWVAARHGFVLPEDKRVPAVIDCAKWEFERNLARLESRLGAPFAMGDKVTIVDILLVHCLNWAFGAGFPITSDRIKAYGKEMRARPAFQRMGALTPA
ncbi:glutathione S-transferase family protein [Ruegeria pomeroyi]|uniref:Glutathione S-transferase family protein n=2 Tax=Ruegeria pomeroyi TaxID=89184 RepID=Q5LMX7_RUEPO|nr:glutathione S-transferase family protein [Ruegeria pomeroyi]AAV96661.1 glutathione S-transferase family protein [Ruegeria pomeroyi DSS-3]NVK98705.1 glutathione S-transferase family protein [Ruegeria pomeroyi]NVL02582.1 glutathione S-transferase family protein [Ruegeria pomeroyi]QWV10198.1 glutathione S-transferase family protein [Ruegeria pomeroyi]